MKKILFLFFLFAGSFFENAHSKEIVQRQLFVSLIQEPAVLSSRESIDKLINFSKQNKFQTLFVQIYRSNKAWYPSRFADASPYEACFQKVGEDPLMYLIQKAHAEKIQVHAWLNLMSLSANTDAPILKKYGLEILTRNPEPKVKIEDYKIDNQYFLEPGDLRVREELVNIVVEIVNQYPNLDGIQFDYIRYPDKNPVYGYTPMNIERFKKKTGVQIIREESRIWQHWKREQVTELLAALAKKARMINPNIQVSTTGLMPYARAYFEAYQDWRHWANSGLIDFVTLMCYTHEDTAKFERYIQNAKNKMGDLRKVNIAVGSYALLKTPEIFEEQFKLCEEAHPRGCAVLHYGDFLENSLLKIN